METCLGEISLNDKQIPTCENPTAPDISGLIVKRCNAKLNIKDIQIKLKNEHDKVWNSTNQETNISITRPAHDRWGIHKIVLRFSDDYLKRVFTFPWYDQWKDMIIPIFKKLSIKEEKVIRCIFACMPSDSKIPVHHDTGLWVRLSHRIHIPIFTNDAVSFQVGKDEEKMMKIKLNEGYAYELNNASKHMVHNNWNENRVHLIFDYVESTFPLNHVKLTVGMKLNQTRRTLDLSTEAGSRVNPYFLILGAQKAGTTAIYDYITQHELVLKAKRKETHYLDWRWNKNIPDINHLEKDNNITLLHLKEYQKYFDMSNLHNYPSLMSGEATPSYLLGGLTVIQRARQLIPKSKFIIMLRDPVDRAFSHYQMIIDPIGTSEQLRNRGKGKVGNKSFHEIIIEEIEYLNNNNVHPNMDFDSFDKIVLQKAVQYTHGAHSFIARGLYALQLMGWLQHFPNENFLLLNMEDMKTTNSLKEMMEKVFTFLDLPPYPIKDLAPKNTRKYSEMQSETRKILQDYYRPFNDKLELMLKGNLKWKYD